MAGTASRVVKAPVAPAVMVTLNIRSASNSAKKPRSKAKGSDEIQKTRATVLHGVCLLAGSAAARARLQQVLATVKAQQSDAKDLPGSVPVEEFGSAETQAQVAATEMVCSSCGTVHEPGMHATATTTVVEKGSSPPIGAGTAAPVVCADPPCQCVDVTSSNGLACALLGPSDGGGRHQRVWK